MPIDWIEVPLQKQRGPNGVEMRTLQGILDQILSGATSFFGFNCTDVYVYALCAVLYVSPYVYCTSIIWYDIHLGDQRSLKPCMAKCMQHMMSDHVQETSCWASKPVGPEDAPYQ